MKCEETGGGSEVRCEGGLECEVWNGMSKTECMDSCRVNETELVLR